MLRTLLFTKKAVKLQSFQKGFFRKHVCGDINELSTYSAPCWACRTNHFYLFRTIEKESAGTSRMKEIASYIQEGAYAFLKREISTISYSIIVLAILLFAFLVWQVALGFIAGTFLPSLFFLYSWLALSSW
jgi:hypothetical protein